MVIVWSGPEIGQRIRTYRQKKKLSQKALAKTVGVSVYRIRLMEAGRIREAEAELMMALCQTLGVEMEKLFREKSGDPGEIPLQY